MSELTQSPTWQALTDHFEQIKPLHMRDMFEKDPNRFEKFSVRSSGILLDYSKKPHHL